MGEKMDVSKESFVSSVEEIKEELAADVAGETKGPVDGDGLAEGGEESSKGEGGDFAVCYSKGCNLFDFNEPNCCKETNNVAECAQYTSSEAHYNPTGNRMNGPAEPVAPYVSRDPDKISPTFIRNLPVPVPDDELADHAKEMARLHHLWVDTKLKQKAFAKSCKGITDKAEEDMVTLGAIIQEGLEERPVNCRWEFDYATGIKKLRRLDNHQICDEETLQGDELHMSFDFQKQGEDNVAKFFEGKEPEAAVDPAAVDETGGSFLTEDELDAVNSDMAEAGAGPEPAAEPKEKGPHACKVCGFDTDSHIYLVRHLRDSHAMKLSEYKAQFPAET